MDSLQILSVLGAVQVLAAYVAIQLGRMRAGSRAYSALNAVGSGLLAYVAVREINYGFILLEGVWALMSVYALLRPASRPQATLH